MQTLEHSGAHDPQLPLTVCVPKRKIKFTLTAESSLSHADACEWGYARVAQKSCTQAKHGGNKLSL